MEENENNTEKTVETVEANTVDTTANATETSKTNKIVEVLKAKKNLIIGILVVILVIFIVANLMGKPEKVVKNFYSAMNSGKSEKMFKQVNWAGVYTFSQLDEDEYEDFWDEYKDYKDSDEWEEAKEEIDDNMDDAYEEIDDSLDDADTKFKVEKIKKVEKIGKNIYSVKAKIKATDSDGDDESQTVTHYVMKDGLNYYLVGGGMLDYVSMYF